MDNNARFGNKFGITNFQLKMIALITMIIDHTGLMFHGYGGADLTMMRVIGRISFPIFAFLISEGCRHTRDIRKYMLRLLAFALISHLCFAVQLIYTAIYGEDGGLFAGLPNYNVFFTLCLGAASVYGYNKINGLAPKLSERPLPAILLTALSFFPFFAAIAVAELLGTDYGAIGVFMIFTPYIAKWKALRIFAVFLGIVFLYYRQFLIPFSPGNLWSLMPYSAMLSLVCIGLYNGERGRGWKWFFYLAYPGHFVILGIIYVFLYLL